MTYNETTMMYDHDFRAHVDDHRYMIKYCVISYFGTREYPTGCRMIKGNMREDQAMKLSDRCAMNEPAHTKRQYMATVDLTA